MLYYIIFSGNLTASQAVTHFLITIFVYIFSMSLHEFVHAFVAFKSGDPTAKLAGRMTLNPIKHLDFGGFLMFILLGVGWAKPVPVNPNNFRNYKKGNRAVSISGVSANFLLGLFAALVYALLLSIFGGATSVAMEYVFTILIYFMLVNSFLVMFNLLPIAPLDGFHFIESCAKPDNKFVHFMARNSNKFFIGIIVLSFATDLLFGFDILSVYLQLLNNFIYVPVAWLGVL